MFLGGAGVARPLQAWSRGPKQDRCRRGLEVGKPGPTMVKSRNPCLGKRRDSSTSTSRRVCWWPLHVVPRRWGMLLVQGSEWYCIVSYCIVLYYIVLALHCIVLNLLYCIVLYLYCIVLYCIVFYKLACWKPCGGHAPQSVALVGQVEFFALAKLSFLRWDHIAITASMPGVGG